MGTNEIVLFGITVTIDPVAFRLFGRWDIYWYGIIIAMGVMLALLYGMKNGNRLGMNPDHIFDSFVVVLPCSILCARAYYIIFDPAGSSFKDFFDFSSNHGFQGLAIYGGVIGAVLSILVMQRIYKFSLLAALDITSVGFLLGQGIGRWGNFINQEAYGLATGSSWFGMTGGRIVSEMGKGVLVHPCFLYESIWCIAGFFLLNHFSKKRLYKGQIALMYGVWYGFERTFIELLRTDSLMIGSLRVSSLLSALLCVACATALVFLQKKYRNVATEVAYTPQFGEIADMTVTASFGEQAGDLQGQETAALENVEDGQAPEEKTQESQEGDLHEDN